MAQKIFFMKKKKEIEDVHFSCVGVLGAVP